MNKVARRPGGYGQYCPLALAAELLCRRWTILVVSRLIDGCSTFGEIQNGLPRISPAQLSARLSELEEAGLVVRKKRRAEKRHFYELTEAGRDLDGIIMSLAVWGQHWARDMNMDDLDPGFLAWSMHMRIDPSSMPPGRTVMLFDFSGAPKDFSRFWLVNSDGKIDMCLKHPGFDADLLIKADLRIFVETWRGLRDLQQEISSSRIRLSGPADLKRAFPEWLELSALAPYERKAGGREQRLQQKNIGCS